MALRGTFARTCTLFIQIRLGWCVSVEWLPQPGPFAMPKGLKSSFWKLLLEPLLQAVFFSVSVMPCFAGQFILVICDWYLTAFYRNGSLNLSDCVKVSILFICCKSIIPSLIILTMTIPTRLNKTFFTPYLRCIVSYSNCVDQLSSINSANTNALQWDVDPFILDTIMFCSLVRAGSKLLSGITPFWSLFSLGFSS